MDTIYILQNSGDCPDLEISPAMARGLISALERLLRSASEAPPSASNDATPPAGLTEREQFIWRLGFNLGRAA
ncbi:hypothetical protein [Caudoviricetes sp.]|nr:hypothetical protein [Caudoviricetes sp.]